MGQVLILDLLCIPSSAPLRPPLRHRSMNEPCRCLLTLRIRSKQTLNCWLAGFLIQAAELKNVHIPTIIGALGCQLASRTHVFHTERE